MHAHPSPALPSALALAGPLTRVRARTPLTASAKASQEAPRDRSEGGAYQHHRQCDGRARGRRASVRTGSESAQRSDGFSAEGWLRLGPGGEPVALGCIRVGPWARAGRQGGPAARGATQSPPRRGRRHGFGGAPSEVTTGELTRREVWVRVAPAPPAQGAAGVAGTRAPTTGAFYCGARDSCSETHRAAQGARARLTTRERALTRAWARRLARRKAVQHMRTQFKARRAPRREAGRRRTQRCGARPRRSAASVQTRHGHQRRVRQREDAARSGYQRATTDEDCDEGEGNDD